MTDLYFDTIELFALRLRDEAATVMPREFVVDCLLRLIKANRDLLEVVEYMTSQFAYHRVDIDGRRYQTAGGLSALELAFQTLEWSDPHYLPKEVDHGDATDPDGPSQASPTL